MGLALEEYTVPYKQFVPVDRSDSTRSGNRHSKRRELVPRTVNWRSVVSSKRQRPASVAASGPGEDDVRTATELRAPP